MLEVSRHGSLGGRAPVVGLVSLDLRRHLEASVSIEVP